MTSVEEIDALIKGGNIRRLGMGSRRACYELPGGKLCVKCYRSDAEIEEGKNPGHQTFKPVEASVVREIRACRFDSKNNTCCQEYRYWVEMKSRLPDDLMKVFPDTMELQLLPSRGWCVVEELVSNHDASPVVKFQQAWMRADANLRGALLAAFNALEETLAHHSVRFFDPQNILVQTIADGVVRLRITDFEPVSRTFIPLDRLLPGLVRVKIRRRFKRYRRQLGL